eukprot:CAMPEP_0172838170 /NCGR_PEP_ID=MMETSP1075-20121228/27687_1 /TAXON_ID=2916 /ORGANISM="Ceratium fusus, Strain PA161109" /LENGTH=63 /DNA_ID=CAMNT_0013681641 /DNA_START=46 /DNA_END=234 /DNA_ORIENTATION=+
MGTIARVAAAFVCGFGVWAAHCTFVVPSSSSVSRQVTWDELGVVAYSESDGKGAGTEPRTSIV